MSEDFRGPGPKEEKKNNNNSNSKTITAIELAQLVVETTSTIIPIVQQLDGDAETKTKIVEALQALQKKAIDYTFAAAKRAQAYNRRARGPASWRKRRYR